MLADATLGLFENCREANISSTVAMVEDVLVELGHFLNQCRVDPVPPAVRAWRVGQGSASVRITLSDTDGDALHLRVCSVVMTMDRQVDEMGLYRHLLEINASGMGGAAFGVCDHEIVLTAERPTLDLDRSEVYDLITRVKAYADEFDDKLVAAFGGTLGARS